VDNSTQDVVGVFIFFLGGPAHHQAPTVTFMSLVAWYLYHTICSV